MVDSVDAIALVIQVENQFLVFKVGFYSAIVNDDGFMTLRVLNEGIS